MSGIAEILINWGFEVSGSDRSDSDILHILDHAHIKTFIGHDAKNVEHADCVVYTAAISEENDELKTARESGIRTMVRAEFLGALMKEYEVAVCVAGTHGKTTTSGMCAYVLNKAGLKPSYVVGGIIPELNTNGEFADNKYFSAELDESDGTIVKYTTDIAVINNLEEDHLDFYKNGMEDLIKTFIPSSTLFTTFASLFLYKYSALFLLLELNETL